MSKVSKIDFKKLLASEKARFVIIAIGLCAIVLIFLSSRAEPDDEIKYEKNFDTGTYQSVLEKEILDMVESVEGAGKSKVLLTLENSYEYIYLEDDKTLQKVNEPTIRGIVVACEGGGSSVVASKISDLISTVLNVPSNKVCVSKLTY